LQMRLASGTATIRIRWLDDGQVYEIDSPNSAISFGRAGDYRVDVNPDGTLSTVRIFNGGAGGTGPGSAFGGHRGGGAAVEGDRLADVRSRRHRRARRVGSVVPRPRSSRRWIGFRALCVARDARV